MTLLLVATIPFMIAAIAVALVPLVVFMRREHELHTHEIARAAARTRESYPLAA